MSSTGQHNTSRERHRVDAVFGLWEESEPPGTRLTCPINNVSVNTEEQRMPENMHKQLNSEDSRE